MGELLGRIVERDQADNPGLMVSSVVVYLNAHYAGPDFYALAQHDGILAADASPQAREKFWVDQVRACYAAHARRNRIRG